MSNNFKAGSLRWQVQTWTKSSTSLALNLSAGNCFARVFDHFNRLLDILPQGCQRLGACKNFNVDDKIKWSKCILVARQLCWWICLVDCCSKLFKTASIRINEDWHEYTSVRICYYYYICIYYIYVCSTCVCVRVILLTCCHAFPKIDSNCHAVMPIPFHSYPSHPILLSYQRKFGWETSELRTFKNAQNSVK